MPTEGSANCQCAQARERARADSATIAETEMIPYDPNGKLTFAELSEVSGPCPLCGSVAHNLYQAACPCKDCAQRFSGHHHCPARNPEGCGICIAHGFFHLGIEEIIN